MKSGSNKGPLITAVISLLLWTFAAQAQTSWKGTVSTAWSNADNWTAGVPTSSIDAVIGDASFTGAFQPTVNHSAACKSLTISATGSPTLTISKSLTVNGDVTINTGGTISHRGVSLTVKGNWNNAGTYTTNSTNARVNFAGVTQSINGSGANPFRKVAINAGSTVTLNTNISATTSVTVDGTFIPAESGTPPQVSGNGTLSVGANAILKVNASTFSANYSLSGAITLSAGSRVEYSATLVNQTIRENLTYSTLAISGSGTKTPAGNLNALNSTTANTGNIIVSAGTLDLSTFTASRGTTVAGGALSVANGATMKIGGTNTFPANYATRSLSLTSTVEYSGTNQTVSAQTYGNLTLSSSSGAAVKTMPGTDFTVAGNLSSTIGAGTSVSYTAASNITVSGNVSIGASTTFNGSSFTHNIAGNWVNNGTFTGSTSSINMTGGGSSISGTGTHNFNNLSIQASNITAAATSSLTIGGNLATSGPGTFTHSSGGTTTLSGSTKTITGSGIVFDNLTVSGSVSTSTSFNITGNLSVSGSLTASGGQITMSGTSKTISGAGTISFSGLSLTGSITTTANFSIASSLDVSGSFSASAGTATFTGTSTLNGTANLFNVTLNGTSLQLSTNAVLGIAGAYTITSGSLNVTATTPNTVNFNGTGAQTVTSSSYGHLILSNGNTKTAGGAITVNGDITIASSTTFNASTFTHTVLGNWINSGTFTASSGTIAFTGTNNVSISGATTFNNLTINKSSSSAEVSLLSNVSVGTVNMTTGTITTGSNTLTMTVTRTGNGIILGNIQRSHNFGIGSYAFESPNNTINITGIGLATGSITVSVTKGSISDFPRQASINRQYTITTGGLLVILGATLRLHYEDDELNGNNETTMQLWRNTSGSWSATSGNTNNATSNYVEVGVVGNVDGRWTISDASNVARWNGSVSSDWFNAANWTSVTGAPSLPPGTNDIVEIGTAAFTNAPVINNSATVKSILFGSAQAATLSLTTGGSLTVRGNVNGTWSGNAAHTIQLNGLPLTVNGDIALSDGTSGHTIGLNAGSSTVNITGSLTQTGGANITFSGTGALNIGSNFNYTSGTFTAGNSTVTYNGTGAQTVAGLSYYNLTVNKATGIAAINSSATINGQAAVTAGELDINAATTITGDVTISSGAILNGDGVVTTVGGNWNNSGSFISLSGTVALNGTGTQNVSATTFNNLTVNKTSGNAVLTGNVTINGNLTITAGTLNLASFTANRSSTGGTLSLASGTTLLAGGSNNFPSNYVTYTLNTGSTVNYNSAGAQSVAGVSYGQLILSNGNTKTLAASATVNGDLTIGSGTTFSASSFTINLGGNWSNSGTFAPGTGTLVLNGSSKTISGATTFNKVTVYGSYAVSGSDIIYNGLLLVTPSGSYDGGSGLATLNGDLTNQGVLVSNGTTTFSGTAVQTIRFINAVTSNSSGIINFNGTVAPVLNSTSTPTYATLNINNTGGVTASVNWIVGVAFNISSGATFNGGPSTHTIFGSFTNNGTVTSSGTLNFTPFTPKTIQLAGTSFSSTGTVNFGGTGAITVTGTPATLTNVFITNSSGVTPGANWNIGGNFVISSIGIFNAGSNTFTVGGDLTSDGMLNGGTSSFTMSSATGQLSGSAGTTFYDFIVTGTITVNSDFNISHNFTNNNAIDASIGAPNFTGSTSSTITGSASSFTLAQFTITKTNATATLAKSITGVTDMHLESGTLDDGAQVITQDAGGGTLTIEDNATFRVTGTNSLPAFDAYALDTLSTVEYAGSTQAISTATAYGNLTVSTTGTKSASAILRILNNFTLSNGTFSPGSFADTLGGNWSMTSGTFTNTGNTIVLAGAGTQTITSTGAFNNLTLNKTTGTTTLSSNITVNGILNFLKGVIQTSSNTVILPSSGSVSGASQSTGWVNGRLQKNVVTGTNVSRTFETGDATNYTPATLLFASVSTAGNVLTNVTATDHPSVTSSGIDASKSVNRYWSFTNSATVFTTTSITVNWKAADVDAGANTANFKVGVYNGSTWSLPSVTSPLSTSIQATGVAVLGDVAIGELQNVAVWTGAVSSNWYVGGNWSTGAAPLTSTSVTIPSSLSTYPIISTGTAACNNITIQSGASVTVSNATLQIGGVITNSGSMASGSGTIEMNGTVAQTIPAALFTGNSILNLTINNSAGVTLSGTLSLSGILSPLSGSFNTGGNLTLLSTASQTALISGSGTGSVLGNVTMQRYLPSAFGYRYISSPFQAATVNQLANDINLSATFPTLYYYDENLTSLGWVRYTTTTNVLNPMQGYAANFGSSAVVKTMDITGVVNNGNQSATLYNRNRTYTLGFNLVGNPYPSPVDWDAATGWSRTNIDNAVYYFNPGTTDQYTGTYSTYINGVSSDGVANNIIPAMQGFFVHVTNGTFPVTGTLAVNNNARVNNLGPSYHRMPGADAPLLRLEAGLNDDGYAPDPMVVYFQETASKGFEEHLDALKLMNTDQVTPDLYTAADDGQPLSINALPYLQDSSTVITLFLNNKKRGWITFYARSIARLPDGWHIYLKDDVAGVQQDIQHNARYRVYLDAGKYDQRFKLVFSRYPSEPPAGADAFRAYSAGGRLHVYLPLPPGEKGQVSVTNLLGQVLYQQTFTTGGNYELATGWSSGIYMVNYFSKQGVRSKKLLITNE
ncbi:T9SS type A sorting domain-containing protein [Chitinophaga tropicalis]|uniref:T9SS type A sorting domain-containing protein n=1 Tax=Chitinophaga tropicalis TaxID=2683588 RepID=A0A7K1TZU3_9BACT|nr:T9SS type A sorting domain-containing protein [Chitinophaga tropicalis]MVT07637.1 T9SS type A sorting domain-containing protein [Chitinophaga tropicalis]